MKEKQNISELIEEVKKEMLRTGTSEGTMENYKYEGFNKIKKYFRERDEIKYTETLANEFVYAVRKRYESGKIKKGQWYYSRRSAEIITQYKKTGIVILRQLPHWQHMHNRLRNKPPDEELNELNNIYGLIWKVRREIERFGYKKEVMQQYNSYGFDPLTRKHEEKGLREYSSDIAENLADEYYEKYKSGQIKQQYMYQTMRRIISYIEEYRSSGKIEWKMLTPITAWKPNAFFDETLVKFEESLMKSGNLSISTVKNMVVAARGFVKEAERRQYQSFDGLSLKITSDIIIDITKNKTGGIKNCISGVRVFLNHVYEIGIINVNLSTAVPKMTADWRKIREGFNADEIKALLSVPDCGTTVGKRNYAIMMLAAQTGLRSIDIVNLKYGDIDWRKKEIRIIQHKTGNVICIPLEPESGNAVADYILNGRAECEAPNIFIRSRRPYQPLDLHGVSDIVTKNIKKSSLKFDVKSRFGAHSFRRAFGTRLLEAKIPFDQLSQLLGHADINSSKPYLSANEAGLRECALGLPANGGAM